MELVTPAQHAVLTALMSVPRGKVATYSQLVAAAKCGSARSVGSALRRNPFAPTVPCHRVVRTGGDIGGFMGKTGAASDEVQKKIRLLKSEGVKFKSPTQVAAESILAAVVLGANKNDEESRKGQQLLDAALKRYNANSSSSSSKRARSKAASSKLEGAVVATRDKVANEDEDEDEDEEEEVEELGAVVAQPLAKKENAATAATSSSRSTLTSSSAARKRKTLDE